MPKKSVTSSGMSPPIKKLKGSKKPSLVIASCVFIIAYFVDFWASHPTLRPEWMGTPIFILYPRVTYALTFMAKAFSVFTFLKARGFSVTNPKFPLYVMAIVGVSEVVIRSIVERVLLPNVHIKPTGTGTQAPSHTNSAPKSTTDQKFLDGFWGRYDVIHRKSRDYSAWLNDRDLWKRLMDYNFVPLRSSADLWDKVVVESCKWFDILGLPILSDSGPCFGQRHVDWKLEDGFRSAPLFSSAAYHAIDVSKEDIRRQTENDIIAKEIGKENAWIYEEYDAKNPRITDVLTEYVNAAEELVNLSIERAQMPAPDQESQEFKDIVERINKLYTRIDVAAPIVDSVKKRAAAM